MLIFFISFFSFILLSKSFLKPFSTWSWKRGMKMHLCYPRELARIWVPWFIGSVNSTVIKKNFSPEAAVENVVEENFEEFCLLDLPDLALDCILERLSPSGLCSMAGVCRSLREICTSDRLWEEHMKRKWGNLIGDAAYQQWQSYIASKQRNELPEKKNRVTGIFGYLSSFWSQLLNRSKENEVSKETRSSSLPVNSIMAWYLAIENGKFWFPAQVYNRENGHVGFILSCYDAELNYDSSTNTFAARYSVLGRRTIEDNIEWHRIRAPAVDTPSNVLHISDCLNDLKPGDHIEVQWRRNKDFSYGWWYGVVGHFEQCDGNESICQCHLNDTIVLEFKQYHPGSRWRRTTVNRKDHREVGNGADGFYGGIRKICKEEEISVWKGLWPTSTIQ
ncbi:OLC1v1036428C1 [Oldenlandia corymbosa var. corymbosa]|uniref:OLC1v1036428C1 n=1 Tax=Oldenlandia corymbosa var. corymbosa TaxID=529605 RepID=A0AAV1CYT0_OLDCO|nr:OLC1v1036428C1 [Oldenlandia corymbosa var. corymbosa]